MRRCRRRSAETATPSARITDYARWLAEHAGVPADAATRDLWQWSVDDPAEFWASIWDYFDVLGSRGTGPVIAGDQMPDIDWFSGSTLNYARNALRAAITDPDRTALIYRSEAGHQGSLQLRRTRRPGRDRARRAGRARRRARRPGRRLPAELAPGADRPARDREPRRDLDLVLAGLRRPGGRRPVRPGHAQGADRRRRLRLQRQAV